MAVQDPTSGNANGENCHVDKMPQNGDVGDALQHVSFVVSCETQMGETVKILGSTESLGSWKSGKAISLHTDSTMYPLWKTEPLLLPTDVNIEYKYIIVNDIASSIRWEDGFDGNRVTCVARRDASTSKRASEARKIVGEDDEVTNGSGTCNGKITQMGDETQLTDEVWVEDYKFNSLDNGQGKKNGVPTIVRLNAAAQMGLREFEGEWALIPSLSDSLQPLMEATGVSWFVRSAVLMSSKYENHNRLVGSHFIVKTVINLADRKQTVNTQGIPHDCEELDGGIYQNISHWDAKLNALVTVRTHREKGTIRQLREISHHETEGLIQRTKIDLTPPGSDVCTVSVTLCFKPVDKENRGY